MANKLKALIVDDEEFARENLSMLIEDFCTDVMVVGKAASAKEARELADETNPDVVFLDIMMPGEDGFSFLESIKDRKFQVIFTTAFREHALRAIKGKRLRLQGELDALNKDDPNYKEKKAAKQKEIEGQKEIMARKQKEVYGSYDPSIEEVNKTNTKSDEKRTIDMTDGSAHVRFPKDDTKAMEFYKSKGYKVTTKYEETELEEACWTGYKKVGMKKKGDRMVPNCVPEGYVTESGDIVEFVELEEGQFKDIDVRKGDLKLTKDKKQALKDKYNAIMAGQASGDENSIADQIQKLDMSIKKQEQELIDIMKKQRETKKEEVSKEKETEFHKKLDTLVHKTFGKRKDEKMPVKESTSRNINEGARALVEAIAALQKKADKSGMPYSILKQVYDRGMAAWKGGHRPGAGQHQWAFARVNSFVTKSSGTWGGADSDLAKKVKGKE